MASATLPRRAVLSGALSLPVAAATLPKNMSVESASEVRRRDRRDFIESVAAMHPNGRLAATRAMALGLDPNDCTGVQLTARSAPRDALPVLMFGRWDVPAIRYLITPNTAGKYEAII